MADEQKPKAEKIENLELNRETVQDLTEGEAERVEGGAAPGDVEGRCSKCTDVISGC
jgi:hypothetical protein